MKKFLILGILAGFSLFLPCRSRANPIDVPYQIYVSTTNSGGSVVLSTANFPSPNATVNSLVASYQWCVDKAVVSCASNTSFTMAYSSTTTGTATTDFAVSITSGVLYDTNFNYRDFYCAPVGWPVLTLRSSVATATVTVQGILYKGWN